jgi:methylisocitrate lyase
VQPGGRVPRRLGFRARDLGSQAARLQAARAAADDLAVRAFINARTDVFFQPGGDRSGAGQDRLDEVLLRAKAYEQAGADGLFSRACETCS